MPARQPSAHIKRHLRAVLEAADSRPWTLNDVPMSRVDAPDGKFPAVTWNVPYADGSHRLEGFLLVQDKRRHVLYELRDMTARSNAGRNARSRLLVRRCLYRGTG